MSEANQKHEVIPCPFCGGNPVLEYDIGDYLVQCENCGASSIPKANRISADDAVEDWNTRIPLELWLERELLKLRACGPMVYDVIHDSLCNARSGKCLAWDRVVDRRGRKQNEILAEAITNKVCATYQDLLGEPEKKAGLDTKTTVFMAVMDVLEKGVEC